MLTSVDLEKLHNVNLAKQGTFAVLRTHFWILEKIKISNNKKNKIYWDEKTKYPLKDGFGFFLLNNKNFLKKNGDWYYDDKNKKLFIYHDGDLNKEKVEIPCLDNLINIKNSSFIDVKNIDFYGSRINTVSITDSDNIRFENNIVRTSANNGVNFKKVSDLQFKDNLISMSNNNGINTWELKGATFAGNVIDNSGFMPGMGQNGDGNYLGCGLYGNDIIFKNNELTRSGYIALNFNGNDIEISENYFDEFCFVKNDGAAIYTWSDGKTTYKNRIVKNNIIINGINIAEGTNIPDAKMANGIYIDDRQSNVKILNNFISKCNGYSIYIHNANKVAITGNMMCDNWSQLGMIHDNIAADFPIYDIGFLKNVLFSKTEKNNLMEYKSIKNDFSKIGLFDSNIYITLTDRNFIGFFEKKNKENDDYKKYFSLKEWMAFDRNANYIDYRKNEFLKMEKTDENKYYGKITDNPSFYAWSVNDTIKLYRDKVNNVLNIEFSDNSVKDSNGLLICPFAGRIVKDKTYLLKYSISGEIQDAVYGVMLRKDGQPYNMLSNQHVFSINNERSLHEVIFKSNYDENKARIDFDFPDEAKRITLFDISLSEANVMYDDLDKHYISLFNKDENPKTFELDSEYFDIYGRSYLKDITLESHEFILLIKK
jgi:hypothetical protein